MPVEIPAIISTVVSVTHCFATRGSAIAASCISFPALVIGVPVFLLHYSIVWALTDGVDVVAHKGCVLAVLAYRRAASLLRCYGDVVGGHTETSDALSETTSTRTAVRITIDHRRKPKGWQTNQPTGNDSGGGC